MGNHPLASKQDIQDMKDIAHKLRPCFAHSMQELTGYNGPLGPAVMVLKHLNPIWSKAKKFSPHEMAVVDKKCTEMKDADIIERSYSSTYASNPSLPPKKDPITGLFTDIRFCINFMRVNDAMEIDRYPLPRIDSLFESLQGSVVFSKLDMRAGFMQVPLSEASRDATTFWWGTELWRFKKIPFGLVNSTAWFQARVDAALASAGLSGVAKAYVDDVLIHSKSIEEHKQHVQDVLMCLYKVGLYAHPEKTYLMMSKLEYLGHQVSPDKLEPLQQKVEALKKLPSPDSVSALRSCLGMLNYYRCYIKQFSLHAQPLYSLLKKGVVWGPDTWGEDHEKSFRYLIGELTTPGVGLHLPHPDGTFVLHTDWCKHGISAVLGQRVPGEEHERLIACISRSLNPAESNYEAFKGELLAVVWAMRAFRHYLMGTEFLLYTDHRPLLWLLTQKDGLPSQLIRFALCIQDYKYTIVHRPGVDQLADVPSRNPCESDRDYTGTKEEQVELGVHPLPKVLFDSDACSMLITTESSLEQYVTAAIYDSSGYENTVTECMPDFLADSSSMHTPSQSVIHASEMHRRIAAVVASIKHVPSAASGMLPVYKSVVGDTTRDRPLETYRINSTTVDMDLHTPTCVIELFGGMAAGLEAALKMSIPISNYLYCDLGSVPRHLMSHRLHTLAAEYSLGANAVEHTFTLLPQDVYAITASTLHKVVALQPKQILVVAGFECQDLSCAKVQGQGIHGPKSRSFFQLLHILGTLQQLARCTVGYIVENTSFQYWGGVALKQQYDYVCDRLGPSVLLDAAQFSARTHRLRNWWTNLCSVDRIQAVVARVRPAQVLVSDILRPDRFPAPVRSDDRHPLYVVNKQGEPRAAFPTFMAYWQSRAFVPQGPGSVWDENLQCFTEPLVEEKELALGYRAGATAAPALLLSERHELLGRCMDQHSLLALFSMVKAWKHLQIASCISPSTCAVLHSSVLPITADTPYSQSEFTAMLALTSTALHCQIAAVVTSESQDADADIWSDTHALGALSTGELGDWGAAERTRVAKRMKLYAKITDTIYRLFPNGVKRIVPMPADRAKLIADTHATTGHFGVKRTHSLLLLKYWWRGMGQQVAQHIKDCDRCQRARVSFNQQLHVLHSLPVEGMFYRWGVDLAGPFGVSSGGNNYIFLAVEYFSKHIELVPIPNKTAESTSKAFLHSVLARFGAPAEVVSDNGGEWKGCFHDLLVHHFIDHRYISPNHSQSNGLVERCVQTVKRCLRKMLYVSGDEVGPDWETQLAYVALGYRCSVQKSTGYSPYALLYATEPTVPPAIREKLEEPLDFSSEVHARAAHKSVLARAALLKERMVIAGNNLKIAQHRDQQWYQHLRDGSYKPRLVRFLPGDYVYVKRKVPNTLTLKAKPLVLRVREVRPTGVLILEGRCGRTMRVHMSQCTICHLSNLDPTVDLSLQDAPDDLACTVCGEVDQEALMLVCDNCRGGFHTFCLTPPLASVPQGRWYCDRCRPLYPRRTAVLYTVAVVTAELLPPEWDLTAASELQRAFDYLMPGARESYVLTRLSKRVAACLADPLALQVVPTVAAEITQLLTVLQLDCVGTIMDPFSGTGMIANMLSEQGCMVYTNDLNPLHPAMSHMDALQPSFYRSHAVASYVSSPYFAVLDLALPLMVLHATHVVCVHVPGHYVSDASPARLAFLNRLASEHRLYYALGLERGPLGRRCLWIIVLADAGLASAVLRLQGVVPFPAFYVPLL